MVFEMMIESQYDFFLEAHQYHRVYAPESANVHHFSINSYHRFILQISDHLSSYAHPNQLIFISQLAIIALFHLISDYS